MDSSKSSQQSSQQSQQSSQQSQQSSQSQPMIELKMPIPLPDKINYSKSVAKKMSKMFQMHEHVQPFVGCFYLSNLFYLYLFKKYRMGCIITNYLHGIDITFDFNNDEPLSIHNENIEISAVKLSECILRGQKIIIIPLMIRIIVDGNLQGSHSNLLIYRENTHQIEHFEPHGAEYGGIQKHMVDAHRDTLLTKLVTRLNSFLKNRNKRAIPITLLKSYDVCPRFKGLQYLEEESTIPRNALLEPSGYCISWSMFFAELCLKNPEIPSRQIYDAIMEKTELYENKNDYLRNVIRGYTCFINNKIAKHFSGIFGEPISAAKIQTMIREYERTDDRTEIINYEDKMAEIMEVEIGIPIIKEKSGYPDVQDKYIDFLQEIRRDTSSPSDGRLSPPRKVASPSGRKYTKRFPLHDNSSESPKSQYDSSFSELSSSDNKKARGTRRKRRSRKIKNI